MDFGRHEIWGRPNVFFTQIVATFHRDRATSIEPVGLADVLKQEEKPAAQEETLCSTTQLGLRRNQMLTNEESCSSRGRHQCFVRT